MGRDSPALAMMGEFTLPFFVFIHYAFPILRLRHQDRVVMYPSAMLTSRIVRKWDWSGHVVAELRGHTDYVYSVAIGTGERGRLLSCGEDHSAVRPSHTL
jgi:hypothetical protein